MPNWCENRVTFYSQNSDDIKKIKEIFESERPFHQVIPEPNWIKIPASENLEDSAGNPVAKKGELPIESNDRFTGLQWPSSGRQDDRWHEWRLRNWDVKWDLNRDHIEYLDDDDDELFKLSFETPWGPPEQIYESLRNRFEDTEITWFFDEPGVQIAGYL